MDINFYSLTMHSFICTSGPAYVGFGQIQESKMSGKVDTLSLSIEQVNRSPVCKQPRCKTFITREARHEVKLVHTMQTLFCVARPAFSVLSRTINK